MNPLDKKGINTKICGRIFSQKSMGFNLDIQEKDNIATKLAVIMMIHRILKNTFYGISQI